MGHKDADTFVFFRLNLRVEHTFVEMWQKIKIFPLQHEYFFRNLNLIIWFALENHPNWLILH